LSLVQSVTGPKVTCPKDHLSKGSLVPMVTGLKGRWFEGSLIQRAGVTGSKGHWSTSPKGHLSEGSVVQRITGPKGHLSERSLFPRVNGLKGH